MPKGKSPKGAATVVMSIELKGSWGQVMSLLKWNFCNLEMTPFSCNLFLFKISVNVSPCQLGRYVIQELPVAKVGWLFPKNSMLRTLFNHFYIKQQENGVISRLQKFHFKRDITCPHEPFHSIDFMTVAALFGLLPLGILGSLISVGFEKYFLNHQKPKNAQKLRKISRSHSIWKFKINV